MSEPTNNITTLRDALFAQLAELRAARPEELDQTIAKSRAVSDLGKTLIDTAKVEVEYLAINKGGESTFLDEAVGNGNLPQGLPKGITGVTTHRLR